MTRTAGGSLFGMCSSRSKNVIFVGILDEKFDDFNRKVFVPQIDGSKTGLELPGIVDEVLTLTSLPDDKGVPQRVFVCHTQNSWGYPARRRPRNSSSISRPPSGRITGSPDTAPRR